MKLLNFPLIFTSILILLFFSRPVQAQEEFKLGVVLPLTGPISIQGVPMKNAISLAQEQNAPEKSVKIIVEDDSFIPKNTRSAVSKLISLDKVDALIVFGTNQGLAIVDLTEQAKIPLISISVNKEIVKNKKFAVSLMPSEESLTQKNITEAKRRNYKKVAILATQQDSCLNQRKIFAESKQFEIVYSDEIAPQETSVREHVLKIIKNKPDAVFLSVLPPQGSLLSKLLRELGFKGEIFGGLQIANQTEFKASMGALQGAWVVSGDDSNAKSYYEEYAKRFKDLPTSESIYAYEAARLIFEAVKLGKKSPQVLNQYLHNVENFPGMMGDFSSDGHNSFSVKVAAKEFSNSGFIYLP